VSRYYRKRKTGRKESVQAGLAAGALAAAAGAVAYYFFKVLLSREPLESLPAIEPGEADTDRQSDER